jgi:hypothetical protein
MEVPNLRKRLLTTRKEDAGVSKSVERLKRTLEM